MNLILKNNKRKFLHSQLNNRNIRLKPKKKLDEMMNYIDNNPQVLLNVIPSRVEINTPILNNSSLGYINHRQIDRNLLQTNKAKMMKMSENSPILKIHSKSPRRQKKRKQGRIKSEEMNFIECVDRGDQKYHKCAKWNPQNNRYRFTNNKELILEAYKQPRVRMK